MGCLALLILAFVFRGAILTALGAIFALLVSLGFWALVLLVLLVAVALIVI